VIEWDFVVCTVYGTTYMGQPNLVLTPRCVWSLILWAGAFLLKVDHVAVYRVSLWLHPSPCHVIVDIYNVITIIGGILDFLVRVWWLDVDPHRGVQRPNKVSINQFDCVLPHLLDPYAPCPPKARRGWVGVTRQSFSAYSLLRSYLHGVKQWHLLTSVVI